jgi:Domain of unknown function (DU1801)
MRPTGGDVEAFIGGIPNAGRRADASILCDLLGEITGAPPVLWGPTIVGFGSYRYRYPSGREGEAPLASFSPRRGRLVVYLIGGYAERHARLIERLGPHETGRGCLYLRRLADIDLDVLGQLVRRSMKVHRGQDRKSGPG